MSTSGTVMVHPKADGSVGRPARSSSMRFGVRASSVRRAGELRPMLDDLHPAVVERYGSQACENTLAT
jgi:hypothetical protein